MAIPDLSQLSHAQKDELILMLMERIEVLQNDLLALQRAVLDLQARLALNSTNSSKPPSSDGLNKPKPKSLRKAGQKPSGGQKGHTGTTLCQVAEPDNVVLHAPPLVCDGCKRRLKTASVVETRQVFDLPVVQMEVTAHQLLEVRCTCGKLHRGQFPKEVSSAVQYGPAALAAVVHLNQHHMLPVQRTAVLMGELFNLPMAQAIVLKACKTAAQLLQPTVDAIAQALQAAPVLHVDETGMRVNKILHWMHGAATETLTWVGVHAKRGSQAFDDLGILLNFKGTLIHDGWKPYRALNCLHGLCNAHHLRELTYVFEELKQDWAEDMILLLTHANHVDNVNYAMPVRLNYDGLAHRRQVQGFRDLYEAILDQGDAVNPRAPASAKRGVTKQSKPTNLLKRLREYGDDVWRFMTAHNVPFTNNIAEQTMRMTKVKQKISGCFRTLKGAKTFCVIRSYLATMHKQGASLFESLIQTFKGNTPQPRFA